MPSFDQSFNDEALKCHNAYRAKHGAGPLVLDTKMATDAQYYAEKLARMGKMQHASLDERNGCGENLACMFGAQLSATQSTDMWYNEIKDYDWNKPGFAMNTGHFTAVVWKASTHAGFGVAGTSDNKWFVVGRYNPHPNYTGQFPDNVLPLGTPLDKPKESPQKENAAESKKNSPAKTTTADDNSPPAKSNTEQNTSQNTNNTAAPAQKSSSCCTVL